jgi:hypothetical protein
VISDKSSFAVTRVVVGRAIVIEGQPSELRVQSSPTRIGESIPGKESKESGGSGVVSTGAGWLQGSSAGMTDCGGAKKADLLFGSFLCSEL